jgi:uncharacterized protein (TIGR03435 family)
MQTPSRALIGIATAMAVTVLFDSAARAAQKPAAKFEVVSIRAVPASAPPVVLPSDWTPVQPGGRFTTPSTTLSGLILFAYEVRHWEVRLLGLPSWHTKRFAVSAAAGGDFPQLSSEENREQVRLMVREMLADRFRLRLHAETRQGTILKMSVEKGGPRLKAVAAPVPPELEGRIGLSMGNAGGRLVAKKVTLASLARSVGTLLRVDVLDETGVKGYYDFDFRWTAPSDGPAPKPGLGPEGQALFITAVKDEFGLRFSSERGPTQYWIVDHAEPPTEN